MDRNTSLTLWQATQLKKKAEGSLALAHAIKSLGVAQITLKEDIEATEQILAHSNTPEERQHWTNELQKMQVLATSVAKAFDKALDKNQQLLQEFIAVLDEPEGNNNFCANRSFGKS